MATARPATARPATPLQRAVLRHASKAKAHRDKCLLAIAGPEPTAEALLEASHFWPDEAVAHPLMPLLALSSPGLWAQIRLQAVGRLLSPRFKTASAGLRLPQHQAWALAAMRRALPLFHSPGGHPAIANWLTETLADVLARKRSRHAASRQLLDMPFFRQSLNHPGLVLKHLAGSAMTPLACKELWAANSPLSPTRVASSSWRANNFMQMLGGLRRGPSDIPDDPAGALEELGWQTEAAEALLADQPMPLVWSGHL